MTNYNKIHKNQEDTTEEVIDMPIENIDNGQEVVETKTATSNTWLNVRSEKSVDSDIVMVLSPGEIVNVIEDCGEWIVIEKNSKFGNVLSAFVTVE